MRKRTSIDDLFIFLPFCQPREAISASISATVQLLKARPTIQNVTENFTLLSLLHLMFYSILRASVFDSYKI